MNILRCAVEAKGKYNLKNIKMKIETFTFIEVENVPNILAVEMHECKQEMNPVTPQFISVHNAYDKGKIHSVDHVLTDTKPEKIIEGVTGGIADHYKEVGFWIIKYKNQC